MSIKQVQHLLAYLGYYAAPVDGVLGGQTAKAIRDFQGDFGGLDVDGIAGVQTQKALRHAIACGIQGQEKEPETGGDFWDSVQYFKRAEFCCPCPRCGGFPVEPEETLIHLADQVRGYFGRPAVISSGVRCTEHNREVGGVANSRHLRGKAVDFCVSGFSAASVLDYVGKLPEIRYAYAIDQNYIHMDVE